MITNFNTMIALKIWKRKKEKDESYRTKDHADWVYENNIGILHFGLSPSLLQRRNIRFDVFTFVFQLLKDCLYICNTSYNTIM